MKSRQIVLGLGWPLCLLLLVAQAISAVNYDLGVAMGFQQPVESITEVGVASWRGFAIADTLVYLPLMALGLYGYQQKRRYGNIFLAVAAGISLYWPIVFGATLLLSRSAFGWSVDSELAVWVFGSIYTVWAIIVLFTLLNED
ncbi:hypothetical protein [Zhongshania marina]|uniref:Uncharacterized protein n=1 Tax=Zhongshania marina TaxID=2304603 RepID=A0ABX9W5P7_9GAMM|nr:hypothetical protein D0911_04290 [Zhongshania marina]